MATEREYKFSRPEDCLPDAEELNLSLEGSGFSLHGPELREQHDLYFDSRRRHLGRAGVALRQRRVDGRELATFKGVQRGSGGLHEREELELPLDNGTWPAAIARRAAAFGPLHSLRPVLELSIQRTLYRVGREGRMVAELAFDQVSAKRPGGEMQAHFAELELEALDGVRAEAIEPLVEALQAALPLTLNPVSKLERAEALLSLAAELNPEP